MLFQYAGCRKTIGRTYWSSSHRTLLFVDRVATCLIAELSPKGAKLKVSASLLLPSYFAVYVSEHCMGYRVSLRWREADSAGVEITNSSRIPTIREWSQRTAALELPPH